MKAISFPEQTLIIAKDQPEYQPLPAHVGWIDEDKSLHGVTFCWKLSFRERVKLFFTGKLWHRVMTFNKPLQPVLLDVNKPRFNS